MIANMATFSFSGIFVNLGELAVKINYSEINISCSIDNAPLVCSGTD